MLAHNFIIPTCMGLFALSYGYGFWPRREIPSAGPDRKGRLLKVCGILLLVLSALRLVLRLCGFPL